MKKHKQTVCPGCSRHCTKDSIRCKRGRAYFAKLEEQIKSAEPVRECRRKWMKSVSENGVLWNLLMTGRNIKKALRSEEIAELQLTGALTAEEITQLTSALQKLQSALDKHKKPS